MDERLRFTINHAKEELAEIEKYYDEGKLTDKGVFVRLFVLGKVLIGWDDDEPKNVAMEDFLQANNTVEALLDAAREARAS